MATNSKIGWTDDTVNFWWGCVEAGPECDHCYARTLDKMRGPGFDDGKTHWGSDAPRWIRTEKALLELAKLSRMAEKEQRNRRVFINSMSDIFEKRDDLIEPRKALFDAIPDHPMLRFLLLTKRPRNIEEMIPDDWKEKGIPGNVALGTTIGVSSMVRARGGNLLNVALKYKSPTIFFSIEPMLENITIPLFNMIAQIPPAMARERLWLLVGGESGADARVFDAGAASRMCRLAEMTGINFFMKQLGSVYTYGGEKSKFTPRDARSKMEEFPEDLQVQQIPTALR